MESLNDEEPLRPEYAPTIITNEEKELLKLRYELEGIFNKGILKKMSKAQLLELKEFCDRVSGQSN